MYLGSGSPGPLWPSVPSILIQIHVRSSRSSQLLRAPLSLLPGAQATQNPRWAEQTANSRSPPTAILPNTPPPG